MMLKDKTIIVTGGSLGIGLAIAKKCAIEGAQVIIAARNKKDLENALKELNQIAPNNHKSYSLDVSILDEILKFADWIKNEAGNLSGLVNCAGIYGPIGKSTTIDLLAFKKAIQTKSFKDRLENEGLVTSAGTPEEFDKFVKSEEVRWREVIKKAKIKAD